MTTETEPAYAIEAREVLDVLAARLLTDLPFEGVNFTGYSRTENKLLGLGGAGITLGPRVRGWEVVGPPIARPKIPSNGSVAKTGCGTINERSVAFEKIRPLWASKEFLQPMEEVPDLASKILARLRSVSMLKSWDSSTALCEPLPNEIISEFFDLASAKALEIGKLTRVNLNGNSGWDYKIEDVPNKVKENLIEPIRELPRDSGGGKRESYTTGSELKEILAFPLVSPGVGQDTHCFNGLLAFNNPNAAMFQDKRIQKLALKETARMGSYVGRMIRDLQLDREDFGSSLLSIVKSEDNSILLDSVGQLTGAISDNDPESALDKTAKLVLPSNNPILLGLKDRLVQVLKSEVQTHDVVMNELFAEKRRVSRILTGMAAVLGILAVEAIIVAIGLGR